MERGGKRERCILWEGKKRKGELREDVRNAIFTLGSSLLTLPLAVLPLSIYISLYITLTASHIVPL